MAGDFSWPTNGTVSQTVAEHLATEGQRAVDITNGTSVPILAAADGMVYTASTGGNTVCHAVNPSSNGYGNYVVLKHSTTNGTLYTLYAHMSTVSVTQGTAVNRGTQLGMMGNTGCSTGMHVHFAIGDSGCTTVSVGCTIWRSPDPANGSVVSTLGVTGGAYPELDTTSPSGVPGPGLHSFIASARNADGTIELFGIGLDNNVYARRQSAPNANSWNGWYQLQGGSARSITATRMADGRLVVFFVASSDSHPRYYMQVAPNVDNWTPMAVFPGGLKVISSAINADGTIELFAIGLAGELYANRESAPNANSWNGWYQLQGGTGATITASRLSDGRLMMMFTTSNDGSIHYYVQGAPNVDNWSAMQVFTGGLSAITSAVNADGTIELFGIGLSTSSYAVYGNRQSAPNSGAWNGWYPLQGGNAMSLTAAPNQDGRLTVFIIGDDANVRYYTQGAPNVDNWTAMQLMLGQLHP